MYYGTSIPIPPASFTPIPHMLSNTELPTEKVDGRLQLCISALGPL
jgi:hypothetical protein